MAEIEAARGGTVHVQLHPQEASLLEELLAELKPLLDADIPRSDAVVQRLFPDAHEDTEQAQAYRDLVDDELRAAKMAALRTVGRHLTDASRDGVTLSEDDANMWLTTLTDMRLAIGTRLEVTEETMAAEIDPDDPEAPALDLMHWLGWMQELMVRAMTESTRGREL